ncbi:MAG: hypothetical protein SGI77_08265 [Pirellulaceae bacterium]|nr:hypothetical protein [Pirellulaceae bacterium]
MRSKLRLIVSALLVLLPWVLRRPILNLVFGYDIHPTARIGFSILDVRRCKMDEKSRIGHLNFIYNLDLLDMGHESIIGRGNWITGYQQRGLRSHYSKRVDRESNLVLEDRAAITNNHLFDCSDAIRIGAFATLAGYGSQFLTHAIDLTEDTQDCEPIEIGKYCFVGTDVVVLRGAKLPDFSVLGAMSLLNKNYSSPYTIYGGVPAKEIGRVSPDMKFFSRTQPTDSFVDG